MKHIFIFSFLSIYALIGVAQNNLFSIEDAVIGQWRELYPQTLENIQWRGESNAFTFQDNDNLYEQTTTKNDSTVLLTLNELNRILQNEKLDTLTYMPAISWGSIDKFHFYSENYWCEISLKEKELTSKIILPENAENENLCYDTKTIAYTINNNLFIVSANNIPIEITNDSNRNIVNGQTVSRNEFGIDGGIFWSPSGSLLAYYRKDESKVINYPLVDITKREAEIHNIKYPMAGMESEHLSIGIFNTKTKNTVFIEANDTLSEKYLTNITWDPKENFIYVQVLNRAQNHMKPPRCSRLSFG